MNLILGSGPTGSACAEALLARGEPVLMIDAGVRLEPSRQALLDEVRAGTRTEALSELLRHQQVAGKGKGLPAKLVHGSDFPYRETDELLGFAASGTDFAPSLAVGGFSNVWGAAALPYRERDILDWPVDARPTDRDYRAVVAMTGLAAGHDDLEEMFPLFTEKPRRLESSAQARKVLGALEARQKDLRAAGLTFGRSRLMVDPACIYCGHCLYGCPYELIYSSAHDLQRRLARTDSLPFRYLTDMIVEEVEEQADIVRVRGFHRREGKPIEVTGSRLFLAAGAAATTRIVLKSRGFYNAPVSLKDSQYFLFPVFTRSRVPGAIGESLHTLSQLFLEVENAKLSPYTIHLQVYTFSELIRRSVRQRLWMLPGLRGLLTDALMPNLLIVQGYFHSAHSGTVSLQLQPNPGRREVLRAQGIKNAETPALLQRLLAYLRRELAPLGLHPLASALEITQPGRGFHTGGSFPMATTGGDWQCDALGRLRGWSRIHLADAGTFPSIPATTITLAAMANAHRIATDA